MMHWKRILSRKKRIVCFLCSSLVWFRFTPAIILLAEEEATTIIEVERLLKQALKCAENAYRKSQQLLEQGHNQDLVHSTKIVYRFVFRETMECIVLERNTNILIYVKRRLGMCARKLSKLREATKIFRDLVKEFPMMSVFNIHENLIEVLLAMQNYADVQGVLAKYDGERSSFAKKNRIHR